MHALALFRISWPTKWPMSDRSANKIDHQTDKIVVAASRDEKNSNSFNKTKM